MVSKSAILKAVILVLLGLQTTTMILTLRYSRTVKQDGPRYLSSTVVMLGEVLKLITSLMIIMFRKGFAGLIKELHKEIFRKWKDGLKFSIPSAIYAFQNNLLFFALSYLDATTYQVTYQLKVLSCALFSVWLLGKKLSRFQWLALVMLFAGVAIVQISLGDESAEARQNHLIGFFAIIVSCLSSGFAGVYFEKLLKGSTVSLWIRNCEMAFFGIIFAGLGTYYTDFAAIQQHGFFQGYNKLVFLLIALHGFGGLLVSSVIKYADSIVKSFAASLSIIVSGILSYIYFGDFYLSSYFVIGTVLVLSASFLYGLTGVKPKKQS